MKEISFGLIAILMVKVIVFFLQYKVEQLEKEEIKNKGRM